MFKRSRRKIVAAIMSVLVLLWVGTLGVIYTSSYLEMTRENRQLLQVHGDMYSLSQGITDLPHAKPGPGGNRPGFADSPMFQLSTFYTVALSYDGQVLEVKNDRPNVYSDSDLVTLARSITVKNTTYGRKNNLVFYQTDKGGYLLVAFMDNTIIHENAAMLLRFTFLFGGIAMVAFFLLAVFLAKRIVKPLEDSYQKQKQFISDAGHELKTPVSIVSANAEILTRELGENQWLDNIRYENQRMGALVSQLLELARTENVTPHMERLDLSHLVNGEALPFESVAFEKGLMLTEQIEKGLFIQGSSAQLKQLVSILLDNAIRHSQGGSSVSLTLTKERNQARLSVVNEGPEIPPQQRAQLFERFYRADDARTGEGEHYGLGLAIAKAIVNTHGGAIGVHCQNGLVEFRVQLPIL